MITRPVGTAIGCLVVHLVYPWLPGLTGVFAFALAMISLMYCCTPGSWVHPIFSTSFALALATLTVKEGQAIQLRLFYLLLAVALVLVVNRFLVPTRKATQFRHNLRTLCRLQASYWEMVQRSLHAPGWPERSWPAFIWCTTRRPSMRRPCRRERRSGTGRCCSPCGTCLPMWSRWSAWY